MSTEQNLLALLEEAVYFGSDCIETANDIDTVALTAFFLAWRARVKTALDMPCLLWGSMCTCQESTCEATEAIDRH